MNKPYKVVISGAQGYVGKELVNLIANHPYLELKGIHAREPQNLNIRTYSLEELIQDSAEIDLLLLATPTEISMQIVAAITKTNINIIDLSGAFRLPEEQFKDWYNLDHLNPNLINEAYYGLTPWSSNQANYKLIANPGCYASCALMSLIPLLNNNLIKEELIIIDAKSGASGAGKQTNPDLMFCEMANNFYPYKIGHHQHIPEIENALAQFSNQKTKIRLTTSILPLVRGIAMTLYVEAKSSCSATDLALAYQEAYQDYPLIKYSEVGKDNSLLSLKNVVQTPYTYLNYFIKNNEITIFSCIDNLLKGAASQVIENINALYQLPLETGLITVKEVL